jgi:hypothetical protein
MKYMVIAASMLLAACTSEGPTVHISESKHAMAVAIEAKVVANEAKAVAESAKALAVEANVTSNDAVEAVNRMAEKCCRK